MPEDNTTPQKPSVAEPAALVGLTKRQQLEKTNKSIFVAVAVASAVLALSIVALQFLVRQALFNGKLISEQQTTERTLVTNKTNAETLKKNIDALLADPSLAPLRVNQNDSSLQVILDALPTTGDATSFSNSLYSKILSRHGVSITGVTVGAASAGAAAAAPVAAAADSATAQPLPFSISIVGTPDQIKETLRDMEKVIRPIAVKQVNIIASGGQVTANIQGETYFLSRSSVQLGSKTIKP